MENSEHQTDGPEMERYGTIETWSRELKIGTSIIRKRLEGIEAIIGKKRNARSHSLFFAETQVRNQLLDILSLPMADQHGFFSLEKEGRTEKYGTRNAWAVELNLNTFTINKCLTGLIGFSGRNFDGTPNGNAFYPESKIAEHCSDAYCTPIDQGDGTIECNGTRYVLAKSIMAKHSLVNEEKIRKLLRENITNTKIGRSKNYNGMRKNTFFLESDVEQLINRIPRAEEVILNIEGVEYIAMRHFRKYTNDSSRDFYDKFYSKVEIRKENPDLENKKIFCFDLTGELLPFYQLESLKAIYNSDV